MAVDDLVAEKDDPPPTTAIPRGQETSQSASKQDGIPSGPVKVQQPGLDEFGLPAKPIKHESDEENAPPAQACSEEAESGSTDRTQLESERLPPSRPRSENATPALNTSDASHKTPEPTRSPQPSSEDAAHPGQSRAANRTSQIAAVDGLPNGPPAGVSGWSHQALAPQKVEVENEKREEDWQDMPAFAPYDLYDDDGKLVAREAHESEDEGNAYTGLGGAGKGYTRVQADEDAQSATSMDENTEYLFKKPNEEAVDEDEEQRDPLAQMQATKDLLTEGQRIAYVGVTRLAMAQMVKDLESIEGTKGTKKVLALCTESMKMWSQQMMVRLYAHMDIDSSGMCTHRLHVG